MPFNIALVEPEIPQNTGNIARTCAATGTGLHLVKPLGFSIEDRYLKRAGLDYWSEVCLGCYESFDELRVKYGTSAFFYASTKAGKCYTDVEYPDNCFLVFGKETAGLPEKLLEEKGISSKRLLPQNKDWNDDLRERSAACSVSTGN